MDNRTASWEESVKKRYLGTKVIKLIFFFNQKEFLGFETYQKYYKA